jgi:hypothetical protein
MRAWIVGRIREISGRGVRAPAVHVRLEAAAQIGEVPSGLHGYAGQQSPDGVPEQIRIQVPPAASLVGVVDGVNALATTRADGHTPRPPFHQTCGRAPKEHTEPLTYRRRNHSPSDTAESRTDSLGPSTEASPEVPGGQDDVSCQAIVQFQVPWSQLHE